MCSLSHDSNLRDSHEGIKRFSWDTVWTELKAEAPTLMSLLALILKNPNNKPVLCLIACMILKQFNHHLSLIQRVISILFYSSGTPKKVSIVL